VGERKKKEKRKKERWRCERHDQFSNRRSPWKSGHTAATALSLSLPTVSV
jgi:hypothetical protein